MFPFPEHFIVRPGPIGHRELIVPLIAVDQLPDWMQLAGVPRELDVEQAAGLINLGPVACDGNSAYEVHLHTGKIRAIMSAKDEGTTAESLAPSDSVSSTDVSSTDEAAAEDQAQATSLALVKQEGETKTGNKNQKPPERMQEHVELLKELSDNAAKSAEHSEAVLTPPVRTTRPWDDDEESDTASPKITSAKLARQVKKEEKQQLEQEQDKQTGPAPEPGLSASRHNIPDDAPEDSLFRNAKDIRPHHIAELRETKARRPTIPSTKDKVFGSNPETVYCRHWCHHGTCKWGWECRYQHRMPSNLDGLREVGLKDFPTWYLLMISGGGLPGGPGMGGGLGSNHNMGFHGGMNMNMGMNAMNLVIPNNSHYVPGPSRPPYPADALLSSPQRPQHPQHPQQTPSPLEMRLMQGRMSALLAGSTAMSNRQKRHQIKEMRELFLRSNQPAHALHGLSLLPEHGYASLIGMGNYGLHQGRANLHTNASLAANAAGLSAATRRQALREAERGANAPVEIPAGEAGTKIGQVGCHDDLDGMLTPVGRDDGGGESEEDTTVREGNLVDVE